ncbi:hypothetical protein C7441_11065 [Pseudaminobacter salicylatoxidans]|uniref:Uncharacterized protein n=1 Tax=Pseudaminobacter salicylatoxidans TaxID=93369 RepID=A0A316C0J4_PSESE|nr:hypothetical protein [Pseudaminobacter salicylatoxidans]PWJ81533.1 hypothetical protein C7441_11065 [Pseudaminobacter salicylatoxidans]
MSDAVAKFVKDARIWLDSRAENAKPGWMVAQIDAVEAALRAGGEPVQVEPLDWGKYRNGDADAVTLFGEIYTAYAGGAWRVTRNGKAGKFSQAGDDLEAAKAAAQADYDQRIRSVVVSAPSCERELAEARAEISRVENERDNFEEMLHATRIERDALAADKARLSGMLEKLVELLDHAVKTPGYGQDQNSLEEAEDHIERARAALSASIPAPADAEARREALEEAAKHLSEIANAMWERCEVQRPADPTEISRGEKEDATTAWCFDKAAAAIRALANPARREGE